MCASGQKKKRRIGETRIIVKFPRLFILRKTPFNDIRNAQDQRRIRRKNMIARVHLYLKNIMIYYI
jgi:hypothetical protein